MSNGYCTHAFDQVLKVIERVYTQNAALIRCGRPDWSEQDWREFTLNQELHKLHYHKHRNAAQRKESQITK